MNKQKLFPEKFRSVQLRSVQLSSRQLRGASRCRRSHQVPSRDFSSHLPGSYWYEATGQVNRLRRAQRPIL